MATPKQTIKYWRNQDKVAKVRVMASAEGYSMVRRPGAAPFVTGDDYLFDTMQEASDDTNFDDHK